MKLESIAQRLDANEKLKVKYRLPVKAEDAAFPGSPYGQAVDVDVERRMLYVAFQGTRSAG